MTLSEIEKNLNESHLLTWNTEVDEVNLHFFYTIEKTLN